ncbi:MAG TPA: NAD(P)-dependent oxidoreductase [Gemmatimonadaceae bacterium]|nr:NAD(P)-dependent oxidoreductase [Gemmatimonadaceae bacterium]
MTRVAFLGLGAIGAPMARQLARRFDLAVWNRTASRAVAFASTHHGASQARTPAEAATGREIVVTCLPTSNEVEQVLDGPTGLLAGLQRGALVIDCTSGDPDGSRRIAARLSDAGVGFIDAPVSGGVSGAEQGTLTVMCGGSTADVEKARPVLEAFGRKIVHCGGIGAGDAVKAVNNAMLAVHIWAAAEGLAALVKSGVGAKVALDVINSSSGRSNTSENLFPERVLTRAFPRTFKLALLDKDLRIAADFARAQKVSSPVLQLTSELFRAARLTLGEEADHVEAAKLVEEWAGTEIR